MNMPEPKRFVVSPYVHEYLLRYPDVAEAVGMPVEARVIASEVLEPCGCVGEFEPCEECQS